VLPQLLLLPPPPLPSLLQPMPPQLPTLLLPLLPPADAAAADERQCCPLPKQLLQKLLCYLIVVCERSRAASGWCKPRAGNARAVST